MKHSATTWGGDTSGYEACLNFESCEDAVPTNTALTSGQDTAKGVIVHMFIRPSGPSYVCL